MRAAEKWRLERREKILTGSLRQGVSTTVELRSFMLWKTKTEKKAQAEPISS
jgi:hypothetical protein